MIVILDNGHGEECPGKCSPDKSLREYAYTREIVQLLSKKLEEADIRCTVLVPETEDIPLRERCRRANEINRKFGSCFLISVHVDALGSGAEWVDRASGWSVRVAPNASEKSKSLATELESAAHSAGLKTNRQHTNLAYWTQNLAICRDTRCPAVLTENLFMTNHQDVAFLLSDAGKQKIVDLHFSAIQSFIKKQQS